MLFKKMKKTQDKRSKRSKELKLICKKINENESFPKEEDPSPIVSLNQIVFAIDAFVQQTQDILACNVFSWGNGTSGALGLGKSTHQYEPKQVHALKDTQIYAIAAGWKLSLFLNDQHQVLQCGKLGNEGASSLYPELVSLPEKIHAIAAGIEAGFAIGKESGQVYSWGSTRKGQLGHTVPVTPRGMEIDEGWEEIYFLSEPKRIMALEKECIVSIATGLYFAIALNDNGQVFSWGKNNEGQLGQGNLAHCGHPRRITALDTVFGLKISAGTSHVLLIGESSLHRSTSRNVWSWGRNAQGVLGYISPSIQSTPCEIIALRGHGAEHVAAGSMHSLVLCIAGLRSFVYAFGNNTYGQCGVESITQSTWPRLIRPLQRIRILSIAAHSRYSIAISEKGQVYSWGEGVHHLTCHTPSRNTIAPWPCTILEKQYVMQIAAGYNHCVALFRPTTICGERIDRHRNFPSPPIPILLPHHRARLARVYVKCPCSGLTTPLPHALMPTLSDDLPSLRVCSFCVRTCSYHNNANWKLKRCPEAQNAIAPEEDVIIECQCEDKKNDMRLPALGSVPEEDE